MKALNDKRKAALKKLKMTATAVDQVLRLDIDKRLDQFFRHKKPRY